MKTNLLAISLLLLSQTWVGDARADFNPSIAGDGSQWVIYADMNALRASSVGKELVAQAEKAQVESSDIKIHVDLQKLLQTVGTITAYGTHFDKRADQMDGTLVVQGTADMRKIAEGILAEATVSWPTSVTELKTLPFEAYAVSSGEGANGPKVEGKRVVIAFPPEPIILVSKAEDQLIRAHEIFLGQSPSLAQAGNSPLKNLVGNSEGAFLFAAAIIPGTSNVFGENSPHARILEMARSGSLAVGENGDRTFAHVRLVSSSAEMATKLGKILEGMTAMMSLAESNDQALNDFLKSAEVFREDNTVTLNLSYSSARLTAMIRSMQEDRSVRVEARKQAIAAAKKGVMDAQMRQRDAVVASEASGKPVATWPVSSSQDKELPARPGWAWFTLERVHLANGTTVTLTGRRNGGNDAQFDRVEIIPEEGSGAVLTFRPEYKYMRLTGYRMVNKEHEGEGASEKKIAARGPVASAQFDFPGEEGSYKVRVHYLVEPEGKATFTLSVKDTDAASDETATHDNPGVPEAR